MARSWPWLMLASGGALAATLLWSTYEHARFVRVLMAVMTAPWG
jgi:hypothetical protein